MSWWVFAIAALVAIGAAMAIRLRTQRRLQAIADVARQALATIGNDTTALRAPSLLATVERAVAQLAAAVAAGAEGQVRAASERARLERDLLEARERHALAASSAGDGLWDWDLKSGRVEYSTRWKNLLGFADDELPNHQDTWLSRIHPDDRAMVDAALDAHLAGRSARFESEHRVLHRDGHWQWSSTRATAIRHANGPPYRLTGLMSDISTRRRINQLLVDLAESLWVLRDDDCFRTLVRSFAEAIGATECYVCECVDRPPSRVRMLARWNEGKFGPCVEFDLDGTACDTVIREGIVVYVPDGAGERWAGAKAYGVNSYLGLPCFDSGGKVIGHVACADPGPMPEQLPEQALLKLFAVRASLELERRRLSASEATI